MCLGETDWSYTIEVQSEMRVSCKIEQSCFPDKRESQCSFLTPRMEFHDNKGQSAADRIKGSLPYKEGLGPSGAIHRDM